MSEEKREDIELAQELRELGKQLKDAVRVAREHPQLKEFERQVSQAVNDLTSQMDRVVKAALEDERVKKVGDELKHATQELKEGRAKEDVERGLAKSVRVLNEHIRRAIEEAEKSSREKPPQG